MKHTTGGHDRQVGHQPDPIDVLRAVRPAALANDQLDLASDDHAQRILQRVTAAADDDLSAALRRNDSGRQHRQDLIGRALGLGRRLGARTVAVTRRLSTRAFRR